MLKTYKNWRSVTEADFVSLFIKTWFAYISTLRVMFPEAHNRRGDKKYLNAYKAYYWHDGHKNLIIDEGIMHSLETLYCKGRKVIMDQYPEYYFGDFYRLNEDFDYSLRDIPPDKNDCLVVGLKLYRNRGTARSFTITGFTKFFGEYYKNKYDENVQFRVDISSVFAESETFVREHEGVSEQVFFAWLIKEVRDKVILAMTASFREAFESIEEKHGKRMLIRAGDVSKRAISVVNQIFSLNAKDETYKTYDEMLLSRNTYEIIQQQPLNYFQYHMEVDWQPKREMTASEERWFRQLYETLRNNSIVWFLDFVYRLRNALFHEIIDPLNEEWQVIFKSAYLVLKEIVDLNIREIENNGGKDI